MSYVFSDIGYRYSINLLLRFLGLIYLLAIYSLWTQIHGLVGVQGILPVAEFLDAARESLGGTSWIKLPTLLWWLPGDAGLSILCAAGLLFSVALMAGLLPLVSAAALWLIYLSLTIGGQIFFNYQWDHLLLECGFLAILVAPPVLRSRPSVNPEPPRVAVFLLYWLLFRVIFSAGYVKLASGDPSWRDLTALNYHFWTQPLPIWTAWYAYQLPAWFLKACTFATLAIEVAAPLLIFGSRIYRTVAFGLLILLQIMIGVTGNFGFFNLLTGVLCLPLLDDFWFESESTMDPAVPRRAVERIQSAIRIPSVAVVALVSGMYFVSMFFPSFIWPQPFSGIAAAVAPFRIVNPYGLFAVMTKTRPEIIIEGSRDGRDWRVYEFACKPGDERHTPRVVAPHMPRLDWQMWFATRGTYHAHPWVLLFMARLIEGSPDVLGLLETNPFGSEPPRYMRAVLYDYTFASPLDHAERGVWWRRELRGLYSPNIGNPP